MTKKNTFSCADCFTNSCLRDDGKYPEFCATKQIDKKRIDEISDIYKDNDEVRNIAQVAIEVQGKYHGKLTRVEETIKYIEIMGIKRVGIACCITLFNEARNFSKILDHNNIENHLVLCKIGAVDKLDLGLPEEFRNLPSPNHEAACNPILQAEYFNRIKTDFNIIIGLCVGHDTLFIKYSGAPITSMIVKDRVTGHNPIVPLQHIDNIYNRLKR